MRYRERREQSAELLRLALAEMGRHEAAFTPVTFAVWYEHLAGINPPLSDAIREEAKTEPRFSDPTIDRLYRKYVAELDTAKAEQISDRFQRMMTGVAEAAKETGETAGEFGNKLSELSANLPSEDAGPLSDWLRDALSGTTQMQTALQTLKDQVASSQQEIASLRADLEQQRVDSTMCPLSRVLNRRGFDLQLDKMLKTQPAAGRGHALVMLDIDHFKKVNDTHGHLIGDRVIAALGEVMKVTATMPGSTCARYGGEEFALLLPSTTPADGVKLAELLRNRVKAMKVRNRSTNEVVLTITVSAGIAVAAPGEESSSLIARADAALYRSKQGGRDRVTAA